VNAEAKVSPQDKTALSYWFPIIQAAGLPVPKTKIVYITDEAKKSIWAAFDGKDEGDPQPFFNQLANAATEIGFPCFLRTDYTSNKHQWEDTCYLKSAADIPRHVFELAEFSVCCDMIGIPWDAWVVRELLPTIPFGTCPYYGNMPVCREFRLFVDEGNVRCFHPYWPLDSLKQGGAKVNYTKLCRLNPTEENNLKLLASRAGQALGGSWSIDILETKNGWYVTDLAEAYKSFHWEGCEKNL